MLLDADDAKRSWAPPGAAPQRDMLWIPGGTFRMGSDKRYPEEAPVHSVTVGGFWMDRTPVTNRDFRRFVEGTGVRHLCRNTARSEGLSRRAATYAQGGVTCLQSA